MSSTVIVLSYRPGSWLAPCLESVTGQADEVVLIDNGSADALASDIGRRAGVRVVRSGVNQGFAPAVNLAVGLARGDLIALLNDDAVAGPGWLSASARALEDPSVAAVGPKIVLATTYEEVVCDDPEWSAPGDPRPLGRQLRSVTVDGEEVLDKAVGPGLHRLERGSSGPSWRWTSGPRPWYVPVAGTRSGTGDGGGAPEVRVDGQLVPSRPVGHLLNSVGGFLDRRGYAGDIGESTADEGHHVAQERFSVSGCALVTRAQTWRELGPLASPFFAYYEDTDWCWRARLAGRRILYDPTATVKHRRSASSGGEHQPWVRVMAERNRTLTMVRNGPRRQALKALQDRARQGPDAGVRSSIARLLPWALATRSQLASRWVLTPEEVWGTWMGVDAPEPI